MKIFTLLIFLLCCFLPLFIFSGSSYSYTPPPYDKIVDELMSRASKRLQKKHNITLIGINEGMMGCVRLMGFRFQAYRSMSKNEARALVVDCVEDFLADINQDEKIRPYLEVFPFDTKHVEIFLLIAPPDRGDFFHPDLCAVTAYRGVIDYLTNDKDNKYKYKADERETFEDAVKILNGEIPAPRSEIK